MNVVALMTLVCAVAPWEGGAAGETDLVRPNAAAVTKRVHGEPAFALRWRLPIVRMGMHRKIIESFGQPAVSNRHAMLIVGTGEGLVLGLAIDDGTEIWRFAADAPFETAAAVVESAPGQEMVLLGGRDGILLALDVASGRLLWKTSIEGDMRAAPQVVGDRVIVTTAANKVLAIALDHGAVLWSQGRPVSTALTVEGHARAAVDGSRVYACFSDGYVSAFDLQHGTLVWSRPLSLRGNAFADADGDPFVEDGRLFVASYSDGIYALDIRDGQTIWNRPAPAVTSLARYPRRVIAASADGFIWGLNQDDGKLIFRTKVVEGPVSRMAVQKDLIAFTAGPNGLVVLHAPTGEPLQATGLGGRSAGDPIWAQDVLAFTSSSGFLYAWAYTEQHF